MRPSRSVRLFLLAAACTAMSAPSAWAQSTSGWSQFQGGPDHAGAVPDGPQAPYRVAWDAPVDPAGPGSRFGLSSPVIAEGLAIAVGPLEVLAVDLATGDEVWSVPRELGPSVMPAVVETSDGAFVLYTEGWGDGPPAAVGATSSPSPSPSPSEEGAQEASGTLVAAGLDDQTRRWSVELTAVSRTGVTVTGDLAIVGANDGTVTAVEVATGEVAWTADAGGVVDAPIAASGSVALVSVRGTRDAETRVLALDLTDGEEAWRYEPLIVAASLGPVSIGDGLAYVSPADNTVRAFSLEDGEERWRARLNSFVPAEAPVLAAGGVLVADVRAQVYRFDAATGVRTWDHAANTGSFRTNLLAVGDTVVLGTVEGDLLSFDLATGDLIGRLEASAAPIRGIAVADEVLVAARAGDAAGLTAFGNDAEGTLLREVSPTTLDLGAVGLTWAAAAVAAVLLFGLLGRLLGRDVAPIPSGEGPSLPPGEEEPT